MNEAITTGVTFGHPVWFWSLLVLIPLLLLRIRSHFTATRSLPGLVSPRLRQQLVTGRGQFVRWTVFFFQAAAIVSIVFALARPRIGFEEIETETEGRNLILAIDTSRSMLANDLQPNRMERAKLAAMDIVRALPEDRVGLIAFAGRPFLQAPLTVDHEAILESLQQLDTEIIPRGGTNLTAAVKLATETFEEGKTEKGALVIFSDGEALEGTAEVEAIRSAAEAAGMTILTIGVGTASGAIIPEMDDRGNIIPGQFIKDDNGQVVRSRLDPTALRSLASKGGVFIHLSGSVSLTQIVERIKSAIETSREESEAALRPIERFQWALGLAAICLFLAHVIPALLPASRASSSAPGLGAPSQKRNSITAVIVAFFTTLSGFADDPVFIGHEKFAENDYEEAIRVYEGALAEKVSEADRVRLQMGIGASAYRHGDFERAADAYGGALVGAKIGLREQAHYNLGNTLFRQGETAVKSLQSSRNPDQPQTLTAPAEVIEFTIETWESAIEHYESALSLNPENSRAPHNIEVVKNKIEELKKQQEEEQQDQEEEEEEEEEDEDEKDEEEKKDEEQEQEQEQDENENQKQDEKDQSNEGDKSDQNEDQKPEEDQENESDQEQDQNQDGKPDESESENESGDPSENDSEEGEKNEADQKPGEDEQPAQPEPSDPNEPTEPQDGDLDRESGKSEQQQPQNGNPGQTGGQPLEPKNPETGYSPSEARQLLRALSDETEVRPILKPSRGEKYKNW
ncbi:VWA domain-containing protein [Verrucomicrobiales bacterium]|nr:VWA domain-containing protein [Verrucomicrobiales bacterium]